MARLILLSASYTPTISWGPNIGGGRAYQYAAESFVNSIGASLEECYFYLSKAGSSPTGNASAHLYSHTGTYGDAGSNPGSLLATSDPIDVSSITTGYNKFTFSGVNRILMEADTPYFIVYYYGGGTWIDCTSIYGCITDEYSGLPRAIISGSWGNDRTISTVRDFAFKVYVDCGTTITADANIALRSSVSATSYVKWDYPSPPTFGRNDKGSPEGSIEYPKVGGKLALEHISGNVSTDKKSTFSLESEKISVNSLISDKPSAGRA